RAPPRRAGLKTAQTVKPEPCQCQPARFCGGEERRRDDHRSEEQVVARHGLRGVAKQERYGDKAGGPNDTANSERAQERVANRAQRNRLHNPLENPVGKSQEKQASKKLGPLKRLPEIRKDRRRTRAVRAQDSDAL